MFQLLKWYGDFVDARGGATICYWAELRWHALHVRYASRLDARPGEQAKACSTIRPGGPPVDGRWDEPKLGLQAVWQPLAPAYEATLYETPEGAVKWCCEMPAARVGAALGYLEKIEMTLPPSALPLETLIWGRWISEEDSRVWIEWRGPHPLRLDLRRGRPCPAADEVLLGESRTLRKGPIGPAVLDSIPGLRSLSPLWLHEVHEQKWLSAGLAGGWAIHEVVQWH